MDYSCRISPRLSFRKILNSPFFENFCQEVEYCRCKAIVTYETHKNTAFTGFLSTTSLGMSCFFSTGHNFTSSFLYGTSRTLDPGFLRGRKVEMTHQYEDNQLHHKIRSTFQAARNRTVISFESNTEWKARVFVLMRFKLYAMNVQNRSKIH